MNYKEGDIVRIKSNESPIRHNYPIGQLVEIIIIKEKQCSCKSKAPYLGISTSCMYQNVSFPDIEPIAENIDDYSIF